MDQSQAMEAAKNQIREKLDEINSKYTKVLEEKKQQAEQIEESSDFFALKKSPEYRKLTAEIFFLEDFLTELEYIIGLSKWNGPKGDAAE